LQRARRLASLKVNGITPNLLSALAPKKTKAASLDLKVDPLAARRAWRSDRRSPVALRRRL